MKQPLKISSQKLPWALLGIMIIIASFLQVITYYSYNKLDNAVQTFIADIREAKDDKEAEEIFVRFVGDSAPLLDTSQSSAKIPGGGFVSEIFGGARRLFGGGKSKAEKSVQCYVDIISVGGNTNVCDEITK